MIVIFAYKFYTLNVAIIMGQRIFNWFRVLVLHIHLPIEQCREEAILT